MTNLHTYKLVLDLRLRPEALPAFRGAVAHLAGLQHAEFHNHKSLLGADDNHLFHRYPLVQYQIHQNKAAIVAWGEGAEQLKAFGARYEGVLRLRREVVAAPILEAVEQNEPLAFSEQEQVYRVQQWIALNKQKHESWERQERLIDRIKLLETALGNHLIAMFKGFDWRPPQRFEATIKDFNSTNVQHRGMDFLAFNVSYSVPLLLPNYFGLGKAVSEGFGQNVRLT